MKRRTYLAQQATALAVLKKIYQAFPFVRQAAPLATGSHQEIFTRWGGLVPMPAIKRALHYHCSSDKYLLGMIRGGERFTIDGEPAGPITPAQQADAQDHLAKRRAKRRAAPRRR